MFITGHGLAARIEAAEGAGIAGYVRTFAQLYPDRGAGSAAIAGGRAVFCGPDSPITGMLGLGMTGSVSDSKLDEVESFFAGVGTATRIEICPLAHPSLPSLLAARPYRLHSFINVYVRPVGTDLPADVDNIGVSAADGQRGVWARTVASGFGAQDPDNDVIAATVSQRPAVTCLLAKVGGQPAGGAAVEIRDGLALLFSHSTLPQYRRQGVHTALLRASLQLARSSGCDLATVRTVPGAASARNVERAGFSLAYTRTIMIREKDR